MKNIITNIIVSGTIALFSAHNLAQADSRITPQVDSTIKGVDGKLLKEVKAGESWQVPDFQPVWIEAAGKVPVVLVPLSKNEVEVNLTMTDVAELPSLASQEKLNQDLAEILEQSAYIRTLFVSKAKSKEALAQINALQAKYPNVHFLNFLKASALYVNGDKLASLETLNNGLKAHPNYSEGLKFKAILEREIKTR